MSFYIVPLMSYQTKQKLKEKGKDKDLHKSRRRRKRGSIDSTSSLASVHSTSTHSQSLLDISAAGEVPDDVASTRALVAPSERLSLRHYTPHKPSGRRPLTDSQASRSVALLFQGVRPPTAAAPKTVESPPADLSTRTLGTLPGTSASTSARTSDRGLASSAAGHSSISDAASASRASLIPETVHLAPFVPVTDLEMLNSPESILEIMLNPVAQQQRYAKFLELLHGFHWTDPINFLNFRFLALIKFMNKLCALQNASLQSENGSGDEQMLLLEGDLIHRLFQQRARIRDSIQAHFVKINRVSIPVSEELVQALFMNYIRYLLALPVLSEEKIADQLEDLKNMYEFRSYLGNMLRRVHDLQRDETGSQPNSVSEGFIQVVTKISYEYIMLEKYQIQMDCKLLQGLLADHRIVKPMFEQFLRNKRAAELGRPFELIKILNYNVFHSVYYSWFLSTLMPFANIYQLCVHAEDATQVSLLSKYYSIRLPFLFEGHDGQKYRDFFSKVKLEDWNRFQEMSPDQFVAMQHQIVTECENGPQYEHKPPNFEFYMKPLRTIPSKTFHMIHSRDMALQLSPSNYKVILREFHRILKEGGTIDLPALQVGSETVNMLFDRNNDGLLLKQWDVQDFDIHKRFDTIVEYIETLLHELRIIFGDGNVKYSVVLLSLANDTTAFILAYVVMRLFELQGMMGRFRTIDEADEKKYGVHYLILVQATKSRAE